MGYIGLSGALAGRAARPVSFGKMWERAGSRGVREDRVGSTACSAHTYVNEKKKHEPIGTRKKLDEPA